MIDRDKAILRAVQRLGDDASALNLWQPTEDAWYPIGNVYEDMKRLEQTGMIEHYFKPVLKETGGRNSRVWRLTAAGEAAIAEGEGAE